MHFSWYLELICIIICSQYYCVKSKGKLSIITENCYKLEIYNKFTQIICYSTILTWLKYQNMLTTFHSFYKKMCILIWIFLCTHSVYTFF